jgi:hypothetical protein
MELFYAGGFDNSYQTLSGPPRAGPSDLPASGYPLGTFHNIAAVHLTSGVSEA